MKSQKNENESAVLIQDQFNIEEEIKIGEVIVPEPHISPIQSKGSRKFLFERFSNGEQEEQKANERAHGHEVVNEHQIHEFDGKVQFQVSSRSLD